MTHTIQDLHIKQALPLEIKVNMTKQRIREWVEHFGIDGVYVSFSGGKDSTVLLHIARSIYPDIKAVFVDTGLEYPEIREFVKTFDNVDWIKPKMNFKQVIEKYGYPFISKEVSEYVQGAKKYYEELLTENPGITTDELVQLLKRKMSNREGGQNTRLLILLGKLPPKSSKEVMPKKSKYNQEKYKFLLEAPFVISNKCCNVMKKTPAHDYGKRTGRKPMLAMVAEESFLRTNRWLQNGCNGFEMKSPVSMPMAFWREQDILKFIKDNNIQICSVYGVIVPDNEVKDQVKGQINICDLGLCEDALPLKTSGCKRTGCMFCGFGCHLNDDERFIKMKKTHPKQYDYIMRPKEQGGLNYKEVIDWINENGNLHIRY